MKSTGTIWGTAFLFAAALLMWGCSDNANDLVAPSGNEITNEERDDLADDFGSALAAQDEGMLPRWMEMDAGGARARDPGEQSALDDTTHSDWNGIHVVLVRNYYDAAGNWFEFYDPETSVRMARLLWIDGTCTNQSGRRTVTVDHFDSLMVFGIEPASEVFTLTGSGERTVHSEFASRFHQNVKTLTAVYDWTVNDVLISRNHTEHPYPLGGSIAVDVVLTRTHHNPGRDVEQTVYVSFVVYFDGSQFAELVFADGQHYWIDLADGRPHRIRP